MRIHKQVYHHFGLSLDRNTVKPHTYAQLYILDPAQALDQRMKISCNANCNPNTMHELDNLIRDINIFSKSFFQMQEILRQQEDEALKNGIDLKTTSLVLCQKANLNPNIYNLPVGTSDLAIIFATKDGLPPPNPSVQAYSKDHTKKRFNNLHPMRDPLVYPLLFPYGDLGTLIILIFFIIKFNLFFHCKKVSV